MANRERMGSEPGLLVYTREVSQSVVPLFCVSSIWHWLIPMASAPSKEKGLGLSEAANER